MKKYKKQWKLPALVAVCAVLIISCATTENYSNRAENYADGKFFNTGNFPVMQKDATEEQNVFVSEKGSVPQNALPVATPDFQPEDFSITWFGHSSLLIHMSGMNILIDPVFSKRTSPVSFAGPKRYSPLPVTATELPEIDILILSHDHYDHMDKKTIRELDHKVARYIVPLGVDKRLEGWNIDPAKIQNMAWWEETAVNGLTIACTPGQHFSGRWLTDSGETLWASWVLKNATHQVFESGDTGFGPHFAEIYEKYGAFDLVLLDCAQYNVRWAAIHMTPEESVAAAAELHAKVAMPIHWGAFVLSTHPWDDPPERFVRAAEKSQIPVVTPLLGQTVQFGNYRQYQERWWRPLQ